MMAPTVALKLIMFLTVDISSDREYSGTTG